MEKSEFRRAVVLFQDQDAGIIEETKEGYKFTYNNEFIEKNKSLSVSLPIKQKIYESADLFPFFAGLLPEGWYLDLVVKTLKIDKKDSFGILLNTCRETIGAVAIIPEVK